MREPEPPRELDSQRTKCLRRNAGLVGDKQKQIVGRGFERASDRRGLAGLEELGDRRTPASVAVRVLDVRPDESARALALGKLDQAVELCARKLSRARVQAAYDTALLEHVAKDLETGAAKPVAEITDLERVAKIGTVATEPRDRLVIGHAGERRLDRHAACFERSLQVLLDDIDHVVLGDERHLEIELREFRLPIRSQILVAEAVGNLVVALVSADHQKLLEELRRLRQRIEAAALHPARDDEIACALGGRLRQDRRLDLEEIAFAEVLAYSPHDLVPQLERLLHRLAAQIEVAMAQAQALVDRLLLVEGERRRQRFGQNSERRHPDLDLSRGEARV